MRGFLYHLFFPHERNNHRAKLLHIDSMLLVIAFFFLVSSVVNFSQKNYPSVLGISNAISVQDLLNLTNEKRKENGLAPLTLNTQLAHAAQMKADDMFAKNYWAHVAPDGVTPWVFFRNSGYEYLYAGENLARGFDSAADVVNAWMNSPTHRENLLSPNYKEIGFAVEAGSLTGSNTILVVQEFGSKYIAKDTVEQALAETPPSPTAEPVISIVPVQQISLTIAPSPTVILPTETIPTEVQPTSAPVAVAAIQQQPLVNSKAVTKNLAYWFLLLFLGVLLIDAIVIERKKIVRVVSHNLDHIIFLLILLIAAIIIGRGLIL